MPVLGPQVRDQRLHASSGFGGGRNCLRVPPFRSGWLTHVSHNWDQKPAESTDTSWTSWERVSARGLDVPVLCGPPAPTAADHGPDLLTSLAKQPILIDLS